MKGITGIIDSKKAFFTLLFFAAATAGWFLDKMTTVQWGVFCTSMFGGYFAAETTNAIMVKPAPSVEITRTETAEGGSDVLK